MVFPPCSRCTCFIFGGLCSTESERRRIEQSALTKYPSLLLRHYHPTYFRFTKKPDPYTPFTTSIHTLNLALGEIVCICMCICEDVCVHAPLCVLACVRVCVPSGLSYEHERSEWYLTMCIVFYEMSRL